MGWQCSLRRCKRALLTVLCVLPCIWLCTGAAVLWPAADISRASLRAVTRPAAALLPPLAPDDAAAVSAVATFVQWGFPSAHVASIKASRVSASTGYQKTQIVGLLPAVGRSEPGGAWAPTTWHGRPLPSLRKAASQHFAVRLVQPNIYVGSATLAILACVL